MTSTVSRVDRVPAGDARFPWAKRMEFTIFGVENNYAGADDVEAGEMVHYRPWERSSEIFLGFSVDSGAEPAGVLRALRHDAGLGLDSFSTLKDVRNYAPSGSSARNYLWPQWNEFFTAVAPGRVAELATQGVRKKYRRAGMMEQIWSAFFGTLRADGVDYVTVALVVPLFEWYHQLLPDRIHQIGDILPDYIGADSVPALVDISAGFTGLAEAVTGSGSLLAATANYAEPSLD